MERKFLEEFDRGLFKLSNETVIEWKESSWLCLPVELEKKTHSNLVGKSN